MKPSDKQELIELSENLKKILKTLIVQLGMVVDYPPDALNSLEDMAQMIAIDLTHLGYTRRTPGLAELDGEKLAKFMAEWMNKNRDLSLLYMGVNKFADDICTRFGSRTMERDNLIHILYYEVGITAAAKAADIILQAIRDGEL